MLTVAIGGERRRVGPGGCALLPRGVPHMFRAEAPSRILEITTPGGIDGFYAENGAPAERLSLPEPASPDMARLVRTAKTLEVEILGPPLSA